MEEKLKEIVSLFIRIPTDQITDATLINRSTVKSSVMLHRLYAKLAMEGMAVENYWDVKNFGNLKMHINGNSSLIDPLTTSTLNTGNNTVILDSYAQLIQPGIGIDMEEISAMPRVSDIREDEFYKMNFAPTEIAYCILQTDSYASLSGLFAAKEAIIKADNNYKKRPFNDIIVDHLPQGIPVHQGFHLSISHTNTFAVAVAVSLRHNEQAFENNFLNVDKNHLKNKKIVLIFLLSLLALTFSILAIILTLIKLI